MFLKQDKSEIYSCEGKKIGPKGKILRKFPYLKKYVEKCFKGVSVNKIFFFKYCFRSIFPLEPNFFLHN